MNNNGTAIAIWTESTGSNNNVFARTFDGTNWSSALSLNNTSVQNAIHPQVAMNDNGSAIAVWIEYTGSNNNVFACTFDGTNWNSVINLNNNTAHNSDAPQVTINNNGYAIAVWPELNGSNLNIYSRSFDGTNWHSAINLNNYTTNYAENPQVTINNNNIAIAIWEEIIEGSTYNIYSRTFNGTIWHDSLNLNSNTAQDADIPQIALNNNNFAIASWSEVEPPFNIFARQTAAPYRYTQWLCPVQGIKQYIAASGYNDNTQQNTLDIYEYKPDINSIDFKTSITFDEEIQRFAVYNKADNDLRLALVFSNPSRNKSVLESILQTWKFDGSSAILTADLSSYLSEQIIDAQWWATSQSQSYLATISQNVLTILDLVDLSKTTSLSLSGSIRILWTTKNDYTGLVILSDDIATPYKIDFSTDPITITPGTGITAPDGLSFYSISTCGDYIAVGFSTTNTSTYGYAQVHLLNLDTDTNTLAFSGTSTILDGQVIVNSLARCCCCSTERPLLVGSYDFNRKYNINIFTPSLSQLYASTLLGNNISSVAWNCQGENTHLAATAYDGDTNDFQYAVTYNFSKLEETPTNPVVLYHD
jgi:hypothetical protein